MQQHHVFISTITKSGTGSERFRVTRNSTANK